MSGAARRLLHFALVLLAAYALVCALLFLLQGRLVWFPGRAPVLSPDDFGLEYRDLELEARDGARIHAWYVPAPGASGAVLVCHGNAGSIEHRLAHARAFHDAGLSTLLFDYRGYGRSGGSPSEEGTFLDAEAAYDWLAGPGGYDGATVAAYGESLGSAVAVELAHRRPLAALVLEAPFTSLPDLAAELYRWLPARLLCRVRYETLEKFGGLDLSVLVVHSPEDEIVPVAHGRRVATGAGAELLETRGGHNDGGFLQRPEWRERVAAFLQDALAER